MATFIRTKLESNWRNISHSETFKRNNKVLLIITAFVNRIDTIKFKKMSEIIYVKLFLFLFVILIVSFASFQMKMTFTTHQWKEILLKYNRLYFLTPDLRHSSSTGTTSGWHHQLPNLYTMRAMSNFLALTTIKILRLSNCPRAEVSLEHNIT